MRRDILFLVKGISHEYLFHDRHYFMAVPDKEVLGELASISREDFPGLDTILRSGNEGSLTCVGFRNDLEDERDAVALASHQLSGIIDGLSFLVDEVPVVADLIKIREGASNDVKLCWYTEATWVTFGGNSCPAAIVWKERTERLRKHLDPFFDIAAGSTPATSELSIQLLLSAKMFRHGAQAKTWGIQYLSKFSALEGLVCGNAERGKERMLKERLSALFFNDTDIQNEVSELWKLRCSASHQAKAFFSLHLDASDPLEIRIEEVERYFFAVVIFALDHLKDASSVDELWLHVGQYRLPSFAHMRRPAEVQRLPGSNIIGQSGTVWKGIGGLFDRCFEQSPVSD